MRTVYLAQERDLGRRVALKMLGQPGEQNARDRFRREMHIASQMDPNVVRVLAGKADGDLPFIIMEYVPGTDLERLVEGTGPLGWKEAAQLIRQAACAPHVQWSGDEELCAKQRSRYCWRRCTADRGNTYSKANQAAPI
jgi:serine/threonine protein kinase